MDPFLKAVLDIAGQVTVVSLLLLILVGGGKERPLWVFGSQYRRQTRELEIWRALALKGANINEQAIQKTGQALDLAERQAERQHPSDGLPILQGQGGKDGGGL